MNLIKKQMFTLPLKRSIKKLSTNVLHAFIDIHQKYLKQKQKQKKTNFANYDAFIFLTKN